MTIYIPGPEHPLHKPFMAGATDMVRNFVVATLLYCLAHSSGNIIQHTVPAYPVPLAAASFARSFHRVEHPVGILNLVEGCGAFGTISSTTCRMVGIPDQLAHRHTLFINVGKKTATSLTVETGGRNQHILFRLALRPAFRIIFHPIIPLIGRRTVHLGTINSCTLCCRATPFSMEISNKVQFFCYRFYNRWFMGITHIYSST